jgi:hypothetical protein
MITQETKGDSVNEFEKMKSMAPAVGGRKIVGLDFGADCEHLVTLIRIQLEGGDYFEIAPGGISNELWLDCELIRKGSPEDRSRRGQVCDLNEPPDMMTPTGRMDRLP